MDVITQGFERIKTTKKTTITRRILKLILVTATVLAVLRCIEIIAGCPIPLFFVVNQHMNPTYQKSDIAVVSWVHKSDLHVGDIIVIQDWEKGTKLLRRIMTIQETHALKNQGNGTLTGFIDKKLGDRIYLTKADGHPVDDRLIYPRTQLWLSEKDILGKVIFFLPRLGAIPMFFYDAPISIFGMIVVLIYSAIVEEFAQY